MGHRKVLSIVVLALYIAAFLAAVIPFVWEVPKTAAQTEEVVVGIYALEFRNYTTGKVYKMIKFAANTKMHLLIVYIKNVARDEGIWRVNVTLPSTVYSYVRWPIAPEDWFVDTNETESKYLFEAGQGHAIWNGNSAVFLFAINFSQVAPGTYTITVEYGNLTDKIGEQSIDFTVDNTPPTITDYSPSEGVGCSDCLFNFVNDTTVAINVTDNLNLGDYITKTPPQNIFSLLEKLFETSERNLEFVDSPYNITYLTLYAEVNATRYGKLYEYTISSGPDEVDTNVYEFTFTNATPIEDGPLNFTVLVVDPAGNTRTLEITCVYLDTTLPKVLETLFKDEAGWLFVNTSKDVYWMRSTTSEIYAKITFYENSGCTAIQQIITNCTSSACRKFNFVNDTWTDVNPGIAITCEPSACNAIEVYLNITDAAHNRLVYGPIKILRDLIPPSAPTYSGYRVIRGGLIIYDLSATDNVGIYAYNVYVEGVLYATITETELASDTLTWVGDKLAAFKRILIINLSDYVEKDPNVTITAIDYGGNEGPGTSIIETIPAGRWYAIEIYNKWNLISLPLIPADKSIAKVLELDLDHGIDTVWAFDNVTHTWLFYKSGYGGTLTQMRDGLGYWVWATKYTVLIVEGSEYLEPPEPARPVYALTEGWNLVGYLSVRKQTGLDYFFGATPNDEGLPVVSQVAFTWDPVKQEFVAVDLERDKLTPGKGYWIYALKAGVYVPRP